VISYVPPNGENGPDQSQKTQYEDNKQNTHGNLLKNNKRDCGLPRNRRVEATASLFCDGREQPL